MRKHFTSILAVLTFTAALFRLDAVVYWPGNPNPGGTIASSSAGNGNYRRFLPAELPGLRQKPLVEEKIKLNGRDMTLEIYQLKTTWGDLLRFVQRRLAPEFLEVGQDYLRLIVPKGKNTTDRWLFVRAEANRPITAFRIEQNGVLPPPGAWPHDLPPLPSGSRPDMIMEIPRVKGIYGSFEQCSGSPEQLLVSYSARMAASGWFNAGAEHSPAIRGSGEIYFRNQPERQIMWVKFGADGHGAFYLKNLK